MAAFRKFMPALAVLVLVMGLASVASAQTTMTCTASSGTATPQLRSEGMTELTGDIVLTCTGGPAPTASGATIPQANLNVFLNTAVTSRLLSGTLSEAMLLVQEPAAGNQRVCQTTSCTVPGTAGATDPFLTGTSPNIFLGAVSGNSITFQGIPVEPPATSGAPARVYRITNIRANASAVAPGGFGTPGQVQAQISVTPITPGSFFTIVNPTLTIGFVQTGLAFSVTGFNAPTSSASASATGVAQCEGRGSVTQLVGLRFREGFASAFKTRTSAGITGATGAEQQPAPALQATPGLLFNTESGFYNGVAGVSLAAGLADFGTRLRVTFSSIPNGISLYVTTTNIVSSATIGTTSTVATSASVARLVGSEAGMFFPVPSSGTSGSYAYAQVALSGGSGTAAWEVLSSDGLNVEDFNFGVFVRATANPANNLPAAGVGNAAGSFAPAPPTFSATTGGTAQGAAFPLPRFADTGTATRILEVSLCRSILLFPYIVNVEGFDTGIAISNTTRDPFSGVTAQSGTCSLNFYGANEPTAVTTPAVAGGTTYVNTAGAIAPGFMGYMIAVCNFQYGHGFAFVSDIGARNVAMGYLALVMPDGGRTAVTSGVSLAGGRGELLGQ